MTDRTHHDPMQEWNEPMKKLLGEEKWNSLNYWQKMCEVAAVQQFYKENPISKLFGF